MKYITIQGDLLVINNPQNPIESVLVNRRTKGFIFKTPYWKMEVAYHDGTVYEWDFYVKDIAYDVVRCIEKAMADA